MVLHGEVWMGWQVILHRAVMVAGGDAATAADSIVVNLQKKEGVQNCTEKYGRAGKA